MYTFNDFGIYIFIIKKTRRLTNDDILSITLPAVQQKIVSLISDKRKKRLPKFIWSSRFTRARRSSWRKVLRYIIVLTLKNVQNSTISSVRIVWLIVQITEWRMELNRQQMQYTYICYVVYLECNCTMSISHYAVWFTTK